MLSTANQKIAYWVLAVLAALTLLTAPNFISAAHADCQGTSGQTHCAR